MLNEQTWLQIQNHVQSLSKVRNLFGETRQIEAILDVVLINFTEVIIAAEATEPSNPRNFLNSTKLDDQTELNKNKPLK